MILDQVLNTDGETKYRKGVSYNFADSYVVNMIYYNSEKLALYSQDVVHAQVRDIDVFTFYYKSSDLAQTHDTVFFSCFVAHLKAGSGSDNESSRAGMVSSAMTYIRLHELPENLFFMGDLNVYKSTEQAYINLTYTYNGERYFYDPIDREGSWNNNAAFKDVHTQSTHANNVDCFSYGGLDDRFDFIMASSSVLDGSHGVKMIEGSYEVLGNDGQHFNNSITDSPTNTSAPSNIIDALYSMSDHLPILAKLRVDGSVGIEEESNNITGIKFENPNSGSFRFHISMENAEKIEVKVVDLYGHTKWQKSYDKSSIFVDGRINMQAISSGTYILKVSDANGHVNSKKFFVRK